MSLLQNKTILITGGSRGIGKAIAIKLATHGANIVIAAKSTEENPKLGGTIFSAAEAVTAAGGNALPIACDIRNESQITEMVQKTVEHFGGIDAVVNNASAIALSNTEQVSIKQFDLMHDINVRGTFLVTKACIPYLLKSKSAHILTLSPPLSMQPQWFGAHLAYTLSKFNMTMMALGWAEEFKQEGIASNALWPATTIATAAVNNLLGGDFLMQRSRKPEIVADAVFHLLQQPASKWTGKQLLDEEVLKDAGINDFSHYAVNQDLPLQKDLFL